MRPVIIIDMQRDFADCYTDETIKSCRREIANAKRRQDWVFLVHYRTYRGIDKRLTELLYEYNRKKRVYKSANDGSTSILLKLIELGLVVVRPSYDLHEWVFETHRITNYGGDRWDKLCAGFKAAVISAPEELRICGVNLGACVEETYGGLWRQLPSNITLIADAVHNEGSVSSLWKRLITWHNCGNQRVERKEETIKRLRQQLEQI